MISSGGHVAGRMKCSSSRLILLVRKGRIAWVMMLSESQRNNQTAIVKRQWTVIFDGLKLKRSVRSPSSISQFLFLDLGSVPTLSLFLSSLNSYWPAGYCSLPLISVTEALLGSKRNSDCRAFIPLPQSNFRWAQHHRETGKHEVSYGSAWKLFFFLLLTHIEEPLELQMLS